MPSLRGQVVLITGASSGIGAATALAAGRAGMRVALGARRREKLEQVARRVRESGAQAMTAVADVGEPDQVRDMVDAVVASFGRIDVLFANAGFGHFHRLLDGAHAGVESEMWRTNYFGALECIRLAARQMIRQGRGGRIVICSSIVAHGGLPYYGTYAATKGALHALACSLRGELDEHGIGVTAVYPVGTQTEFSQTVQQNSGAESLRSNTPRRFMQTSEHVAKRIIAALSRPNPPAEVWPSRLGHVAAAAWTLFPRLRARSFRRHCQKSRQLLPPAPRR